MKRITVLVLLLAFVFSCGSSQKSTIQKKEGTTTAHVETKEKEPMPDTVDDYKMQLLAYLDKKSIVYEDSIREQIEMLGNGLDSNIEINGYEFKNDCYYPILVNSPTDMLLNEQYSKENYDTYTIDESFPSLYNYQKCLVFLMPKNETIQEIVGTIDGKEYTYVPINEIDEVRDDQGDYIGNRFILSLYYKPQYENKIIRLLVKYGTQTRTIECNLRFSGVIYICETINDDPFVNDSCQQLEAGMEYILCANSVDNIVLFYSRPQEEVYIPIGAFSLIGDNRITKIKIPDDIISGDYLLRFYGSNILGIEEELFLIKTFSIW